MDVEEEAKSNASKPPRPDIDDAAVGDVKPPNEHGGPKGPEPTRYGDWERNGRCYDF